MSTLIQANMDHWISDPNLDEQGSLPRTKLAMSLLGLKENKLTADDLWWKRAVP